MGHTMGGKTLFFFCRKAWFWVQENEEKTVQGITPNVVKSVITAHGNDTSSDSNVEILKNVRMNIGSLLFIIYYSFAAQSMYM